MKTVIFGLFILSACTSLPKGELQLRKMILDDHPRHFPERASYVQTGRPIYIESTSYPFMMPNGHISMSGKILVYLGREELSLKEILPQEEISSKDQNNKNDGEQNKKEIPNKPSEIVKEMGTGIAKTLNPCVKPRITKQGNCNELRVDFDLTSCTGIPVLKQGHKVLCRDDVALFGVRFKNTRYRIKTHKLPLPLKGHWNLSSKVQITYYKP